MTARRRRALDTVVGAATAVSELSISTLSAPTADGDGQHSGRSRMARVMTRMTRDVGRAVTTPALPVEALVRGYWFAGPPAMLHLQLPDPGVVRQALSLAEDSATLVVAALDEVAVGDVVLAVLQLPNGTFLQLPAVVLRQGVHRLQLGLPGLTRGTRAALAAAGA